MSGLIATHWNRKQNEVEFLHNLWLGYDKTDAGVLIIFCLLEI